MMDGYISLSAALICYVETYFYNICAFLPTALSQGEDNFVLCPEEALAWNNRKLHILEELLTYNATILCLEEVDCFDYLQQNLADAGYSGIFLPKPDSPCLYSAHCVGPDGCALFWRSDEVTQIFQKGIVLHDDDGQETNQVALLCRFTLKELKKEFYVVVTHLKSKTPFWQLRHEQGKYLEKVLSEVTVDFPVIICGDFNAEPNEKVYQVFRESIMDLGSAYCHLNPQEEEPSFTTWKIRGGTHGKNKEVAHCIDYIWYSRSELRPISLLKFPSEDEIGKDRLPSLSYPSDHLSLVVDFGFIKHLQETDM